MNQNDDIDDTRAALIDQRISQAFDFLGDVIDDPHMLETIPDGSTLAFRDVAIRQGHFRLTANRPSGSGGSWTARVTGYTKSSSRGDVMVRKGVMRTPRHHDMRRPEIRTGETAWEALDALENALRDLVRATG